MGRLSFFLSGEHPTIPASEVKATIEAEGSNYQTLETLDQILLLETDANLKEVIGRLGMCHWVGEQFSNSSRDDLLDSIGSSDLTDFLPQSKNIAIRVKRVKNYFPKADTRELAREIANILLEKHDYEIDLERPEREIQVTLTDERCVLSIVKARTNRSEFSKRRPPKRAAVHPSTMQPSFARALVNLARTPKSGTFLDPFCGIGGILIEAGLIGADIIGVDINPKLLEGAEKNLEEAGIEEFKLIEGDSRDLELNGIDAIATDPPYGRQSSTGGLNLADLYKDVFPTLSDVLKEKGYLCITAPSDIDLEEISKGCPLNMVETHQQKVHKSLERQIYVFRRKTD